MFSLYCLKKHQKRYSYADKRTEEELSQKVLVAQKDVDWLTKDWNQDIELLDGHFFNIGQYLKNEGVKVDPKF